MSTASKSILLGVNIDHVATLRQVRQTSYPVPFDTALVALAAGADAITVHLREDRRHIQDHDVARLCAELGARVNLEMAVTDEMCAIARRMKPTDCCLVPEKRAELTTEGGLDVAGNLAHIGRVCGRLSEAGIRVSLFTDPDPRQIDAAISSGAPAVEIHTGHYSDATDPTERERRLNSIASAAAQATSAGLQVNAGHGLNYGNVQAVAALDAIRELNIGHAIIAQAVLTGLHDAVAQMKRLMNAARA